MLPVHGTGSMFFSGQAMHLRLMMPYLRLLLSMGIVLGTLLLLWKLEGRGLYSVLAAGRPAWSVLILCAGLYALLLSIPFVPGMELGWLMMGTFGVPGILAAWLSTVLGLILGFACARGFRQHALVQKILARRAALCLVEPASLSLFPRLLRKCLYWQAGHPYLFMLLTLNMPGNLLIGGGGGIAWLSGVTPGIRSARFIVTAALATCVVPLALFAGVTLAAPDPANWQAVVTEARGQTVYWHAWGGDSRINDHISWLGGLAAERFGITLRHVKLADTAEAVSRILAEKAAGTDTQGAVDLLWLNGENFATLRQQDLLFGPWAEALPNWRYVDVSGNPALLQDFTLATGAYEVPWTRAQLVFYHDTARQAEPPLTLAGLLEWAHAHPGRFAFPQPPDFLGTTFLKQTLHELVPDPSVLVAAPDPAQFEALTRPLWTYLDQLTPMLWRAGRAYPPNGPRLRQLLADGEIDLGMSLNPGEVATAIANAELPESVRSYILAGGSIGNTSYVAIPFNASATAGAMVIANLLLSPEAQARQQDIRWWGSPAVLAVDALPADERHWFAGVSASASLPDGPQLPEPHPQWTELLEREWQRRYGLAR